MDSIDLLLGERASTSIIRTGTTVCIITAEFNISNNFNVKNILSELSIDVGDEIIIRRQIDVAGKSKAFINDVSVSVNTLSNIGKYLNMGWAIFKYALTIFKYQEHNKLKLCSYSII